MTKNPANTIKDTMWYFLMDKGQKGYAKKKDINWDSLDMELMRIVIEATSLVLSGELDKLEEK